MKYTALAIFILMFACSSKPKEETLYKELFANTEIGDVKLLMIAHQPTTGSNVFTIRGSWTQNENDFYSRFFGEIDKYGVVNFILYRTEEKDDLIFAGKFEGENLIGTFTNDDRSTVFQVQFKPNEKNGELITAYHVDKEINCTYRLPFFDENRQEFMEDTTKSRCSNMQAIYPKFDNTTTGNYLNQLIKKDILSIPDYDENDKIIGVKTFNTLQEKLEDALKVSEFYITYEQEYLVRNRSDNHVVIEKLTYYYSGGAHGNYNYRYFNINLKNKKQLLLSDVVKDTKLVEKVFFEEIRKIYGRDLKAEGYTLPKSFEVTPTGLRFVYDPYDAGSYAEGAMNAFIPFTKIKSSLNSTFKF